MIALAAVVPAVPAVGAVPAVVATPNPPPQAPPGLDQLAGTVLGWLTWGVLVAAVVAIAICAGMIVIGRRQRSGLAQEGMIGSAWVLGGLTLASLAAVLVGVFAGVGAP